MTGNGAVTCSCGLQALVLFDRHLTNTTFRTLNYPDPHHLDVGRAVVNMLLLVLVIALFGGQGVENSPEDFHNNLM